MTRWMVAFVGLAACAEPDPDSAFVLLERTFRADLDADSPSRVIDVMVEAPVEAERSGTTGVAMRVEFDLVVEPSVPWENVQFDAFLYGRSVDEEHLIFTSEGTYAAVLLQPGDAECELGTPCVWRFPVQLDRLAGNGTLFIQGKARALLSLGTVDEAPVDPGELTMWEEENLD